MVPLSKIIFNLKRWISEKLDGIRAYWDGTRLVSKQSKVISCPNWFVEGFPKMEMDGELWMGRGQYETLMATISSTNLESDSWKSIQYVVFDLPKLEASYEERMQR